MFALLNDFKFVKEFVIPILLMIIFYLAVKLREYQKNWDFRDAVAWFAQHKGYMRSEICAQIKRLELPELYYQNNRGWDYVDIILDEFEIYLYRTYMSDQLIVQSKISGEQYFFSMLMEFLRKHENDIRFAEHEMVGKIVSKRKSDYPHYSCGMETYHIFRTYEMTEFSIAFHKLMAVAIAYCNDQYYVKHPDQNRDPSKGIDFYTKMIQTGKKER